MFAGLLLAGEVAFHAPGGVVTTAGPQAADAVRSTQAFGRVGVGLRDSHPSLETLDRAARRLEAILGTQVLPLENDVSAKAREQLPSRLEPLAVLSTHLRLLALTGAERAQTLAETGHDLMQQDGAGAIAILGAVECSFPEDLQWARRVAEALANGADRDILSAREIVRAAAEVEPLLDGRALVESGERDTLRDVVASDTFYTRLADLRGITRTIGQRAVRTYCDRLAEFEVAVEDARARLETRPEWVHLLEEDRAEIAARLANTFPSAPADGEEIACLRLLLMRRATLPGLMDELEQEVDRRTPSEVPIRDHEEPQDVDLVRLVRPAIITTPDELDAWIDALRAALEHAFETHTRIRIREAGR